MSERQVVAEQALCKARDVVHVEIDARGLDLTVSSEKAARHLDQAVADFLNYLTTASSEVKAALELATSLRIISSGSIWPEPLLAALRSQTYVEFSASS